MTDGAMLAEILNALEIPCDKYSFHGKLKTLAAGLDIQTEGRLLGDVLDDIAAKQGITRDSRLYGYFIRKLYDYVTSGEDVTLSGNPLVLANALARPLKECVVAWEPTQEGSGTPSPDNIRPISGRDSVKVERCGENLLKTTGGVYNPGSGYFYFTRNEDISIMVGVYLIAGEKYTLYAKGDKINTVYYKAFNAIKNEIAGGFQTINKDTVVCSFTAKTTGLSDMVLV